MKYIIYGAFSTAIMLFGISLVYGSVGYLKFEFPTELYLTSGIYILGVLMVLAGLLFKLSAFPFHFWVSDVFQGAPITVAAFFSIAPKVALLLPTYTVIRISYLQFLSAGVVWHDVLSFLAIVTIIVGNFLALRQDNVKKLIAYSSIAQAGFLMVGLVMLREQGLIYILFYAVNYMFANLVFFYFAGRFIKSTGTENISEWSGLGKKTPVASVCLIIALVSLIGLPPTGGFLGKLFLFGDVWNYTATYKSVAWLLVLGLVNAVVALFYYLRIPFFLFIKKEKENIISPQFSIGDKIFLTLLTVPMLVFFIKSDWLMNLLELLN